MLLDSFAGVWVYRDVVTLQRCVGREGVHHRSGRHCHTDRCALQKSGGDGGIVGNRVRKDGEEDEASGTAADAPARHVALADLGHGTSDIATLKERADDADRADEHPVLPVVPVEHCAGHSATGQYLGKPTTRTVERKKSERKLDTREDTQEEEM